MADLLPLLLPTWPALLPPGARVVACVSGGPDSQVLLDCLARSRAALGLGATWAVGVDHGLRPEAADELRLAGELAAARAVPFVVLRVRVPRRGNRLAAARTARYAALRAWAATHGATRLAVGHTASDQAETVLQRLAAGCALGGVGAMRRRRGDLVRPLLGVARPAVEAHLVTRGLRCARDPSNHDPQRARTRLRAEVLPALACLNAGATAHLAAFAALAQEDEAVLDALARRAARRATGRGGELAVAALARLPAAIGRRVLTRWLRGHGMPVDRGGLTALWEDGVGGATGVAAGTVWARTVGGRTVRREAGALWLPAAPTVAAALPVGARAALPWPGAALRVTAESARRAAAAIAAGPAQGGADVAFDADRLHFALALRPWQKGDRLRPFGGQGTTTVGDLFTNLKLPRALRLGWPVVVHGAEVAWVVGLRRAALAPLGPSTRRAILLKVEGACPWGAC